MATNKPDTTEILQLIASDMQEVDYVIQQRLTSDVPLIADIAQYIIAAGGKRLRPALLLLICGALDYQHHTKHQLAAVIELIHTATLLHDDVVDASTLRRGRPTANETFGNPASVLVGDFLHTRSFQMMVECGDMRVLEILSHATNVIAEGEVLQLMNMHDADLQEDKYLHVIRSKTAKLFEVSAQLGAVLAKSTPAIEDACTTYGQALGTAFQIIDDVLDYDGQTQEMGKHLGDDLREGKTTLPLIFAMHRGTQTQAQLIREAIEQGETSQLEEIISIVKTTGALDATRDVAHQEAMRARQALNTLPPSPYCIALEKLTLNLLSRRI